MQLLILVSVSVRRDAGASKSSLEVAASLGAMDGGGGGGEMVAVMNRTGCLVLIVRFETRIGKMADEMNGLGVLLD